MASAGGQRFGKYELISRLAKGGMGETYLAEFHAVAGVTKRVVIKKMLAALSDDQSLVQAFIQEARVSTSLSHGNIAQVFDFGEVDGEYFLAMEYVDGQSLQSVVRRANSLGWPSLPAEVSAYVTIELLKALHYAHTRAGTDGRPLKLVHRDVSPDNLLISWEGEVKLVDFGVAKASMKGRAETEPGTVKGKYRYFSPEQATASPLDARSDVFTTGTVLYELLTGRPAFDGPDHQVMGAIVNGDLVSPRVHAPHLPDELVAVVHRAMSLQPEQRFSSALAMQEALSRWLYARAADFSSEVLREMLGELFAPELAKAGTPFVPRQRATGLLRAIKDRAPSGSRATAPAPLSTRPAARAPPTTRPAAPARSLPFAPAVVAGGVLLLALGVAVAGVVRLSEGPDQTVCETVGDVHRQQGNEVAAILVTQQCLGDRTPTATVANVLRELELCRAERERLSKASRLMETGELTAADRELEFRPSPCTARQQAYLKTRVHEEYIKSVERSQPREAPPAAQRSSVPAPLEEYPVAKPPMTAKGLSEAKMSYDSGQALFNAGAFDVARGILQDCVARYPQYAPCHSVLGATLVKVSEPDAAIREYRRFIELAPNDPSTPGVIRALEKLGVSASQFGTIAPVCLGAMSRPREATDEQLWECGLAAQLGRCEVKTCQGNCRCRAYVRSTTLCHGNARECVAPLTGNGCSDRLDYLGPPFKCTGPALKQSACMLRYLIENGYCR